MDYKTARDTFEYNPNTGDILWKNSKLPAKNGTLAGTMKKETGYIQLFCNGKLYLAHRIAMLISYGELSDSEQVDHINHIRTDNRLENLRLVPLEENNRNRSMDRRNSTGITGVRYDKRYGTYSAHIGLHGKELHLGSFKTKEEAAVFRKSAEFLFGFHSNHGK